MNASARIWRQLWVPATFAAVQLLRMTLALRLPGPRLTATLPDDTFYYLQTARTFAATGRWSFDGVEPASGFHLLWGYVLAAIYRLHPAIGLHAIVAVAWLIGIACMTAAAWLCVRTAERLFGPGAELGVGVIFLSALSLQCGGFLMEAPFVMLISAALLLLLSCNSPISAAAILGCLGVLARSDFGLLPLALFIAAIVLWQRDRSTLRKLYLAAAALAGAVAGQAIVAFHTHWISGAWIQASARQKLFWSSLQGFSVRPILALLLQYFDSNAPANGFRPWGLWIARALTLALFVGIAAALRRHNRWAIAAMLAVVAGYVALYRFNSADLQVWYIAEFQVPLAILAAAAFAAFRQRQFACLGFALCCWGVIASMPWHPVRDSPFYRTAIYLRQHPELRPAASWNAGIIGYVSGGGVTNLDGLVNDRIHPYAVSNTTLDYVRARHLKTILDFPTMVDPEAMQRYGPPNLARRNGYGDGRLQSCLHLQTMVGNMGVYRVDCAP